MKFKKNWKRFWTLNRHHAEGFTLVELIVVIAILAILGGIAVPAYSGYVEKAERAADEQLLAAVNTAFAAACAINGENHYGRSDVDITLGGSEGAMTVDAVAVTGIENFDTSFGTFYEGGEFKVITNLYYNAKTGGFAELPSAYAALLDVLSPSDVQTLMNSVFGEMGTGVLLGKVDYVSNLASALLQANDSGTLADLILGKESDEYGKILAANLGIDLDAEGGLEEYMTTVGALMNDKMALLQQQNPEKYAGQDPTDPESELYQDAYYQIASNNAVLHAAQNTGAVSGDILSVLGGTDSKGQIVGTINTNSGEGLAQAALAYGMYTAYAERKGLTVSENPADVLLALDSDQGFKDYINNADGNGYAQTDLDGYLASMNMINSSAAADKDAVADILVNGFANEDLVGLLQIAQNSANQ